MLGDVGSEPRDIFGKYVLLRHFLRVTAVLLTFVMAGEVMPAPLYAAAGAAAKQFVTGKVAIAKQQIHSYEVMQDLKSKMAAVKPADFVKLSKAAAPPMGTTIIDEIGRLRRAVPASDAALWRTELHGQPAQAKMDRTQADYYAQRHIWLGEYLLAYDRAPREAAHELRQACSLTNNDDYHRGIADYDLGLCIRYEHNFRGTVDYLHHMLAVRPVPQGFDQADAASMLREADACLGYHQGNVRLGIPEPPFLDPLCGAAALAASLKVLGVAYDRQTVLSKCYVDEEGSNLQNLIDAGHKLGASVYPIAADDQGLMLMPKPAIAFIEADHFISVIRADKKGVAYLCSDCGDWPGGEVDLSWNQWHHMQPGIYGVVVRPGSQWDQFFKELPALKAKFGAAGGRGNVKAADNFHPGVQLASLPSNESLHLTSTMSTLLPVAKLLSHLTINMETPTVVSCEPSAEGTHCACGTGCPMDAPAGGGDGASDGDPVNLATGEEEYSPAADLTVYNPIGPSVRWSRTYGSLRVPYYEPWYQYQDFGEGWSQNYNIGVNDPSNGWWGPSAYKYIYEPNGARILFLAPSAPTASNPVVQCQVQLGFKYVVTWNYNSSNATTYYVITDGSRNRLVTSPISSTTLCSVLTQISDRNGNTIHFNYSAPVLVPNNANVSWPLLTSITDSNGSPLLVINRAQDGTGAIASVDDRYGRTVYYHVGYYSATVWFAPNIYCCDRVSQIEPTDTANPPDRYHYGYTLSNNNDSAVLPKLATISVPNPTGSTTPSIATITYDPSYATVNSLTDANGNERSYQPVDERGNETWGASYTKVTITGADMPEAYNYTVSFNSAMSELTRTDGAGNVIRTQIYGDANNPYSPTVVGDALGNCWTYNYTAMGYGLWRPRICGQPARDKHNLPMDL